MKTNAQKQTQNPNVLLHLVAIILIAITMISSSIGLYAWARYTSTQSSNATAQIAKWYFNLKTGQATIDGNTRTLLQLTRTDNREHVVEGKLAPGTYGILPIIVDTTGTETDLTYDVLITINNCPQNMVFTPKTPASTTQTVAGDGTAQNPRVRTIRIQKYVPWSQTGEHDETISWDWPYETTSGNGVTANDDIDTADSGKEVTVTITAVGTEVLNMPVSMATITYTKGNETTNLSNGSTVTLQMGDTSEDISTLGVQQSRAEAVTYTSSDTSVATINENGEITKVGVGTTEITIRGSQSGEEVVVNVKVKPQLTLQVGDYIEYTPSGSYGWDKRLADSSFTGTTDEESIETLTSGESGAYKITRWRVLNVDNETGAIDMVPDSLPSSTVLLRGAQGYNNAVKLLNDACTALYSGPENSGITARSININDIENAIKAGGDSRVEALKTAKTNVTEHKKDANPYNKNNSYYPTIYEREISHVIDPEPEIEQGKTTNLGQSEQTEFITKTESNAIKNEYKQAGTSIQPYQTYYSISWASTAKETLLRKNYWVASRCVSLYGNFCGFYVFSARSSYLDAFIMFDSSTGSGYSSRGLFPVVSLNSKVLNVNGTQSGYNRYIVDFD